MIKFIKLLGILSATGVAIAVVFFLVGVHRTFSSTEFKPAEVRQLCDSIIGVEGFQLTEADELDHAWKDHNWLDSKILCRMKTTPERVRALRTALLAKDGRVWSGWKTSVQHTAPDCTGDEYACPRYGEMTKEKRPDWWKTGGLLGPEWIGVTELHEGGGQHGVNYVISEAEGLVFAERWKT
jgi:hypothetical protein